MLLSELLEGLKYEIIAGEPGTEVGEIIMDSRKACEGCLFVCIRGAVADGHKFAPDVARAGASVLVVEDESCISELEGRGKPLPAVIKVADSRYALACISAAWFGHPARELKTIGITGTKGKTTTTYMVKSILERMGHKVGLIGTIEATWADVSIPAANTTPESYLIQKYFRQMADAGCDAVVMEASSQGFMLHRTAGFTFDYGIFTNIEPDHIGPNEHRDFQHYLDCKKMLLEQCRTGIINRDDEYFEQIVKGVGCDIETYGIGAVSPKNIEVYTKSKGKISEKNDIRAENMELVSRPGYLGIKYDVKGMMNFPVEIDIPGKFSVYNSLTAIAICRHFEATPTAIVEALKDVQVEGRVELIKVSDDFSLMIDYAHNAMALESLLETLREYRPHRLVTVFGCGGNRARDRRFEMGEVSGRMADLTIITSDNPRNEDPQAIIDDIRAGISKTDGKYVEIIDRKEAIKYAIEHGEPGDIIICAGKGHETYQEINGVKYDMDERVLIKEILEELK
ncbi:MAG: UDP-N-acetylmuramoyl-L-alanyl-D-glutamate--2,6-diaminopimelate ligase [Bacillota bacterium]|nr:UDP-N-acetylmuramoyl-L-alanyl-D-glutamate--2,6-diaminopimelate ligase [Bacillota bacterium]